MAREERLLEEMLRLKLNTTANSMLPPKQVRHSASSPLSSISISVADPASGAFLTTGSGIRFFPDLGSRIPNSYF
jgi:hypothetical protein